MQDQQHQPYKATAPDLRKKPPTYLVLAILVTLFCCIPAGIPAIWYAAKVDGKWMSGDAEGANKASANARLWILISFGVGILFILAWFFSSVV